MANLCRICGRYKHSDYVCTECLINKLKELADKDLEDRVKRWLVGR